MMVKKSLIYRNVCRYKGLRQYKYKSFLGGTEMTLTVVVATGEIDLILSDMITTIMKIRPSPILQMCQVIKSI